MGAQPGGIELAGSEDRSNVIDETKDRSFTLAERLHENIEAIEKLRQDNERHLSGKQVAIERAARALGRPATLFLLVGAAVGWIALNLVLAATGREPVDRPPFLWLQGVIALYAAMTTTLVLIAQGRQVRDAEHRAHLELHVNLMAEQKASKIISLLEELRRDLPEVRNREDPVAAALEEDIDPKTVHVALRSDGKPKD